MVWRWGLWEVSSHQSGALMNRISALQKGPQRPPRPIHHVGHSEKTAVREPESQPSLDTQTFQFRDQREINFCGLYTSRSMLICHRGLNGLRHTQLLDPSFLCTRDSKTFPCVQFSRRTCSMKQGVVGPTPRALNSVGLEWGLNFAFLTTRKSRRCWWPKEHTLRTAALHCAVSRRSAALTLHANPELTV